MKACARPHLGKPLLIRLDLKDFFGSVTENMVYYAFLEHTGYPKKLCRFFARICCYQKHLPQGAATSPMLSNIVFRNCDEMLAQLATGYGLTYTRYCDDLFFSGDTVDAARFIALADLILAHNGFRRNKEKTKVLGQQHLQTVLGLTVNEKLQVTRQYRRKLQQEVYYLEKFGKNCEGALQDGDYLRYVQRLLGKVTYALSVCEDDKLRQAADRLRKRIILIEGTFF